MKNWIKNAFVAAALVGCSGTALYAQEGGRGDRPNPEEMRARMMERTREQLEVKDDAEWKVIEGKIQKVNEARRATGGGFGGGMAFGGRRPGGEGRPEGRGDGGQAGGGNRRGGFGGEPSAEMEALSKAIESKASPDDIKAKLAKVREARKANEAKLEAAQEELRKVLSVRQEAVAVMNNLLK